MASFDKYNLGHEAEKAAEEAPKPTEPAAGDSGHQGGEAASKPGKGPRKGPFGKGREGKPKEGGAKAPAAERTHRRLCVACGVATAIAVASLGIGGAEISSAVSLKGQLEGSCEQLVTLTRDVRAGEVISEADLEVASVPAAWAPSDAATDKSQVAGKVAVVDLTGGNAVSRGSLSGSETASRLPAAVSAGNVGYMLSFSSSADAASPMLRPGDRVDVMAGGDGMDATVICSDVRVIAVDGSLDGSEASAGYSTVTFDLTYDQAAELFATTQGSSQSVHLLVLPQQTTSAGEAE